MKFNPYAFGYLHFQVRCNIEETEYAIFDDNLITCTDYSLKPEMYSVECDDIEVLGPELGMPASIVVMCFETWLVDIGYFGEPNVIEQRPLPPGSVIRYQSFEAVVIKDDGGPTITVRFDGEILEWVWKLGDAECEIVSVGTTGKE